jgi:hypothetical protein
MGKIGKGMKCSVSGCSEVAVRSMTVSKAKNAGLDIVGRRAYLCREHYKTFKKGTKNERRIERWRHGFA